MLKKKSKILHSLFLCEEDDSTKTTGGGGGGKRRKKKSSSKLFVVVHVALIFSSFGQSRSFLRVVRRRLFEKRAILL